jgi:sporulation protein YlmC with PRC-barrel domain
MSHDKDQLAETETAHLIAADKVQGTEVYNPARQALGTIENVMIDKPTGRVAYAVMSFGGFLGIGKDRYALPWGMLRYDTELGGYVVDIDERKLQGAPTYDDSPDFDWEDEEWGRRVHEYYQVPPNWR